MCQENQENNEKVVLITGASSGIGEATAYEFARHGYKVAAHGRNASALSKVVEECDRLSPNGNKAFAVLVDFTDSSNAKAAVEKTIEHFKKLDVLVSNAGIFQHCGVEKENGYELYRTIMNLNLDASVNVGLAAVSELKKTNGNIVYVSSIASLKPNPHTYPYSMSKAALNMFAQCMAQELAPNVRVNIICPGPIDTPIYDKCDMTLKNEETKAAFGSCTLLRRVGESNEVAKFVYFMASDDAKFITGSKLIADGGYMINCAGLQDAKAQLMRN